MKNNLFLITLVAAILSGNVFAEIYKRVDADGRITYSNIKTKNATRLELDHDVNTNSDNHAKTFASKRTSMPVNFPSVDRNTQKQRDSKRKDILQNELDSEKMALDNAKKSYAEFNQDASKTKDGKTLHSTPKFEEKNRSLQVDIDNHQKNIGLLQKELDLLR